MKRSKTYEELASEMDELRLRLEEANDVIDAIRAGEIDALVVKGNQGPQLYTLKSVDHTYRIFIEQMSEGAVTLGLSGNILYCNTKFSEMVGWPLEKVFGQPLCKYVTPACQAICDRLISGAWKRNIKGELNLLTAGGSDIPVKLSLKTLDFDDSPSLSLIVTDLTEQKEVHKMLQAKNELLEEAENVARQLNVNLETTVQKRTEELEESIREKTRIAEELRSNQEQLGRILETMAEGVGIIDIRGNLTYANPMAQKILGLRQIQTSGKTYYNPNWKSSRLDGTLLPEEDHPMQVSMHTGKTVYDYEICMQPPDREAFYISINAAPVRDESGNITGCIGTFMDVTHRRKVTQQKDDFISVASHELKTPITSLKAALQLLDRMKSNPSDAMLPAMIDQANRSMKKVTNLIADLLDAGKYTQGQLHLNKTKFVLSRLIENNFNNFDPDGNYKILIKGNPEQIVYGDPNRIEQVVLNFVNNAIKYAPESKEIIISIEQEENNQTRLSVIDKGPGIPAEKLPHLFDRYYRVDEKGLQYSGLGLGLYICAEIIKKHEGKIGAKSEMGKGSVFWFTLPG